MPLLLATFLFFACSSGPKISVMGEAWLFFTVEMQKYRQYPGQHDIAGIQFTHVPATLDSFVAMTMLCLWFGSGPVVRRQVSELEFQPYPSMVLLLEHCIFTRLLATSQSSGLFCAWRQQARLCGWDVHDKVSSQSDIRRSRSSTGPSAVSPKYCVTSCLEG